MNRKYLTLEDLLAFYENHYSSDMTFDAKENGGPLVVSANDIGFFEEYNSTEGLMFLKFKVCHTGINRNGSRISKQDMERAMPSICYRPVLAYIKEDENGDIDFDAHNYVINDDNTVDYYESQVGSFTAEAPSLEYDSENGKTYLIAYAAIPKDYTRAAEILERKSGTKVSCELCVNSMSYDSKEKILDLTDFYFNGVTLLGESITEGMQGSRADIVDSIESFSIENNSMVALISQTNEMVKQINEAIQKISYMDFEKGGDEPVKLNELLEKYGKTVEDLDFDYENMSDEELEAKFEEIFDDDNDDSNDKFVLSVNGKEYTFEISMNDKIYALGDLVNETYAEADDICYAVLVYDDYVIMIDCWNDRAYKQSYSEDDGTFALEGERVEVYASYLTAEEEEDLDEMRSSNETMQSRLDAYEKAEADAAKENVFNNKDYDIIRENEEFAKLVKDAEQFTLEEVQTKCDALLLDYVKANMTFANDEQKKKISIGAKKEESYSPYGSLFKNY